MYKAIHFFMNSAAFYPDLRPDCFPNLMNQARDVVRQAGAKVFDGAKYVGKIKLKDQMHFSIENTKLVVQMYSEVMIEAQKAECASAAGQVIKEEKEASMANEHPVDIEETDEEHSDGDGIAKNDEEHLDDIAENEKREEEKGEEEEEHPDDIADKEKKEEEEEEKTEEEKKEEKKQEEEMQRTREAFFAKARDINLKNKKEKVEPQLHDPPFPTKMPQSLPDGDDRFNKRKNDRVFVCDGCGVLVSFSSRSKGTGWRYQGEFQGSWQDHSWKDNVDGSLLKQAYELRMLDCRWYCTQFCGAEPSGVKDRMSRPAKYRATQWRMSQRRYPERR